MHPIPIERPDRTQRTEDEILSKAAIKIRFGEKDYDVKPLTILKARVWREKMIELVKDIAGEFQKDVTSQQQFFGGLSIALLQFPEKIAELIFLYGPELPQLEIEENATEEQLAVAFSQIMVVAFPFLRQLATINEVIKAAASLSR